MWHRRIKYIRIQDQVGAGFGLFMGLFMGLFLQDAKNQQENDDFFFMDYKSGSNTLSMHYN